MKMEFAALAVLAALTASATATAAESRVTRVRILENGEMIPVTRPAPPQPGAATEPAKTPGFTKATPPTQPVEAPNPAPVPGLSVVIPPAQAVKKLPVAEQKRLDAVRDWEKTGVAEALVGQNGSIEYPYNYARPIISCAPLHICTIILQPGEAITSLSLGDTVRWLAAQSTAGNKPVIVVKPTQAAISTSLVVTTDAGRVYYMHLVADKSKYVPIVSFYDPAAMMRTEQSALTNAEAKRIAAEMMARAAAEKRDQEVVGTFKQSDPSRLDFGYVCKGDEDLIPTRVFGSDTHTYIQMPEDIKAKDAPAIFALRGGEAELLNVRAKGDYYIVDGKPDRLQLLVGVGKNQSAVMCERKKK